MRALTVALAALALLPGAALAQPAPAPPASSAPASSAPAPAGAAFAYDLPGSAHATGGKGFSDASVFVPGMRFPIDQPKAFANSQVYGHGGASGPGGGQCDAQNYAYPWHDNFCEALAYKTPMCPAGNGHQGQDIRPSSCVKARWLAVAAEAGKITQIGSYTVYLTADDGRVFRYLHLQMDQLKVRIGDRVERGQPIGYVSNNFGKTPTTIHLHFEVKEPVTKGGKSLFTFVPPYSSLVDGYQRLLAGAP
jgi:murein DD-endopeptidase MepM/ murein hydrolase activator NlpD